MRDKMTVAEAARYLGVTKKHIHQAVQNRAIGHVIEPAPPKQRGPQMIRYVSKKELDAIRADGFFRPRGGK